MNTWNILPESYQQRVYKSTPATVQRQIKQAENPTPAMVISVEATCIDNAILLDYMTSDVALEKPGIRSTDPNILIENNCTDYQLHFGMPGSSGDYQDEGDDSDERNAIPICCWRRQPTTELPRFVLGASDVDGNECKDGDDADAVQQEEALPADDGSMQNVEDWGHTTRKCEDWTVYFRPVKYDNGEANEMASDVSKAKTVLQ